MIGALENSLTLFTSTCKVLIQTEFNDRYIAQMFVTGSFEMSLKYSYVGLRRSLGPQIVALPNTHLNRPTISHSSAHVAD